MKILSRAIFKEIFTSAALGTLLFTFVLFLRTIERLSTLLVRNSAPPLVVAKLFFYALPASVPFSLPLGVLVGILIGLSRMSADGEITALRAAGVPSTYVARPVLTFAFLAMAVTAATSLWLTPMSLRLESDIARNMAAAQLTAEIEPRVFNEDFPNTVLYVGDVGSGKQIDWQRIFLADTTSADDLRSQGKERGDGPRITIASSALATPDVEHNRIQLDMKDVRTTELDKEGKVVNSWSPTGTQVLQAQKPSELRVNRSVQEMDTLPLYDRVYNSPKLTKEQHVEAAIEFHQRLALPFGCILLASVGIPLGVSVRRGGKSTAFVLTVLLAFLYYMAFITLIGMARKGSFSVPVAVWSPNILFAIAGGSLLLRLEKPGERDFVGFLRTASIGLLKRFKGRTRRRGKLFSLGKLQQFGLRPMLMDAYVINNFLFYFSVLLVTLVMLIEIFTFFELLSDMFKNHISMAKMLDYLYHLAPKLIYDSTPISVLVASLICFGVMTKNNEVTAFKAGGVSVHRLALPVLVAAFMISAGLFAFDHYYIPQANRRQEALRSEIKGRPVQTYLRPDRKWVYGEHNRIYNFLYLDPRDAIMSKVNVYEVDPATYQVVRQISAERARWEPSLQTWVFQNGMSHVAKKDADDYKMFYGGSATFPSLKETPSWFIKEEKQYKEMNFEELGTYINELKASGLDTIRLQVQYHKKFSVPLFALIMALLSIPFAFVAGNRGAMTGVGISFGIAISYWTINTLFEQIGDLNQLPSAMAAWSPDLIFGLAGLYFMARMRT